MDDDIPKFNIKHMVLTLTKYAAIFVIAFILGRESVNHFQNQSQTKASTDIYSVENVLSQVSEDDINNYLIENVTYDKLN